MSATFDCDLFAQYFALPVRDRLEPAPVITVDEAPHTVSEYYIEDIQGLGEVRIFVICNSISRQWDRSVGKK